jgi:hypothetical protein
MEFLNAILTSQGLGNTLQSVIVVILVFILFRKGITNHIILSAGIATKADMDAKLESLGKELKADIQSLKENDIFHHAMAMLLLAQELVKNKERFERIKDMLMETVPESKKPQMQAINFDPI